MMLALRNKLFADQGGAAIIELALVAPIFALMTIGVVDISNAYSRKLAVEQGAQRAVEKIMQTTQDDTVENTLKQEARCQVNGVTNGTCNTTPVTDSDVTVTWRLECNSGGTITAQTATDPTVFDTLTCTGGATEARYIQVTVNDKYSPMFPIRFSGLDADGTYHVSATAGMRTQ